ncbi:MAG: Fur family transcriptional regulator [Clostridiaceae bacterium]|nr:Fur family transcriptional regulator [Clostridiaceae bacterium]
MKSIAEFEAELKGKGYKLTEQRKFIIEVFNENPGHHTAHEVFDLVKCKLKGINFSTIYRNLELLSTLKIISKMYIQSGISYYELCGSGHHHHLICKGCGETREVDICPYANLEVERLNEIGFKATDHKFEIFGYCSKCR